MRDLHARIEALTDEQAEAALVRAIELGGRSLDLAELAREQERLEEALGDPELAGFIAPGKAPSNGDLARLALRHLADAEPDRVRRAVDDDDGRVERAPIAAFVIGALVLYVFSSELKIEKHPDKGWSFRFHKRPLKDGMVGRVLSELYNAYIGGPPPPAP
ncbi:hypothetical protein [Actinomadura xylanilytica]|uniref:hypothetical protein n=1 Tax=Actinomadura xylanilytica TaxID=887459 RepID=UPI00255B3DE0|nr:hypothetical protein [Actinomadura xylanilytica]MDL4777726.1 hypothetical protein [Actinomadura xylanilytica]